ncbi:Alkaline phosphatase synthesis transcriptional regulatory protein PhoP [Anaerolineales bacterium]|nr:Alkaline phosphatase synthesis transcriptional regulatory protein PhoP [Anaerolineales bacterium]
MADKILVIEDEAHITRTLRLYLEQAGYQVAIIADGAQAMPAFRHEKPDLVILDLHLPHVDGWEICRQIRREGDTPIIMLTARSEESDKLIGLELGADDYVTKPFSPREVTARVRVVLRRSRGQVQPPPILRADTLILDLEAHTATQADQPLDLTPTEFEILAAFMRHPGQAFTRLQLVEAAQGGAYEGYERVIDQHIKNLRAKLGDDARAPRFVQTVFGVGYRFSAEFRHDA